MPYAPNPFLSTGATSLLSPGGSTSSKQLTRIQLLRQSIVDVRYVLPFIRLPTNIVASHAK